MSRRLVDPGVAVSCTSCELDFDDQGSRPEASYFARTHNELHHGGRIVAIAADVDPASRRDSLIEAVIEAAAEMDGEQGREWAAESVDQGQGDLWLDLLVDQAGNDAGVGVGDDADGSGW